MGVRSFACTGFIPQNARHFTQIFSDDENTVPVSQFLFTTDRSFKTHPEQIVSHHRFIDSSFLTQILPFSMLNT